MIHDLPRGSRFTTYVEWKKKRSPEGEEQAEANPDEVERWEMRQWSSLERELLAGQLNTLNDLLRFTPSWKKTPPEVPVVGPKSWWPESQIKTDEKARAVKKNSTEGASIEDALKVFGWVPTQ